MSKTKSQISQSGFSDHCDRVFRLSKKEDGRVRSFGGGREGIEEGA